MSRAAWPRWVDWPYRAGAALHGAWYRRGLAPRRSLGAFTVSVGALHFGGAGKTPLVRALAGPGDAVLIRGYGGRTPAGGAVLRAADEGGDAPPWARTLCWGPRRGPAVALSAELGDEAVLLAATGDGVPVGVGADRVRSAAAVCEAGGVRRLLLDDGFSHHRVARDRDVVVLPVVRRGRGGVRVAAGPWREGRGALGRATHVVLSHDDDLSFQDVEIEELRTQIRYLGPLSAVRRGAGECRRYPGGEALGAGALAGVRAFAVCALGRPRSFLATVRDLGAREVGHHVGPDHHRFRASELARAERLAAAAGAEVVLTTLKDAVRLPPGWRPAADWVVVDLALHGGAGHPELLEDLRAP